MTENTAIDTKDKLRKAIKAGKTECVKVATLIEKVIADGLLEFLSVEGETMADKLLNLIVLPYDRGGLNTPINEFLALISIKPSTELKVREIVHQAKPGERTDLKKEEDNKVEAKISPPKKGSKGNSESKIKKDRSAARAIKAIPELEPYFDDGLVTKTDLVKLGKELENPEEPTDQDKNLLEARQQVKEIVETLPKPPLANKEEKKKVKKQVQQKIEEATGVKTPTRVTINTENFIATAKAIIKALDDLGFVDELIAALELEKEEFRSKRLKLVKNTADKKAA